MMAGGRSGPAGLIIPGTTAKNAISAVGLLGGTGSDVTSFHPFPDVAVHIVKTERVGHE